MFKLKGKDPPCNTCIPNVLPQNQEVWSVYSQVKSQVIMGHSGPVALNFNAVRFVMDILEVEDKKDCFERVVKLWHHISWEQSELAKVKK